MARAVLCAAIVLTACGPARPPSERPSPTIETQANSKDFRAFESLPVAVVEYAHRPPPAPPVTPSPVPTAVAGVRASSYPLLVEALPVLYAAEARHGLPRGLLAAIAVWESSGGRHACGANWWGYASCGVEFASIEGGAEIVARTLAGYGVDTWTALCWYNAGPSGCRAGLGHAYADRVLATMEGFR